MNCTKCELHKTSQANCVKGRGDGSLGIMLVSEALGKEDELYQAPLTGSAGRMLDEILGKVGLDRSKLYITNVVKCRPQPIAGSGKENRAPSKEEIAACSDHLDEEIKALKPKVIIPLGGVALNRIVEGKQKITNARGKFITSEKYNCLVLPTYNPNALFHHQEYMQSVVQDFTKVKNLIEGKEEKKEELNYLKVMDRETLDAVVERMKDLDWFTVDIETTDLNFLKAQIICIGFSWKAGTGVGIPLLKKGENGEPVNWWNTQEEYNYAVEAIKKILTYNGKKCLQNGNFDIKVIREVFKIDPTNFYFDTKLAHHLVNENMRHNLDLLTSIYVPTLAGYKDVIGNYLKSKKESYINVPTDVLLHYNICDADVTGRVMLELCKEMDKEAVTNLFYGIVMPLQRTLIDTEYDGVQIDEKLLAELDIQYTKNIADLLIETQKILGAFYNNPELVVIAKKEKKVKYPVGTFNLNSSKMMKKLLYEDLKMEVIIRSKQTNKPSTDKKALALMKGKHPIIDLILKHRTLSKIKATYIDGIKSRIDKNGLIHTSYLVEGTRTGRLASRNPNLQNIPRSKSDNKEEANKIRHLFIPRPGRVLVYSDMKQFELRVLTAYAKDKTFMDIFARGEDPHKYVAVNDLKGDPNDEEVRMIAKTINFGIPYGRSAMTLAETLKMSVEKAEEYLRLYFLKHKEIEAWINDIHRQSIMNGVVTTIFGRKRRIDISKSKSKAERRHNLNEMTNFMIQSTASDIISMGTNTLHERLRGTDSKLILTVHDSITYDVTKENVELVKRSIEEIMTKPIAGFEHVPFGVDIKTGTNWGELVKEEALGDEEDENEEDEDDVTEILGERVPSGK